MLRYGIRLARLAFHNVRIKLAFLEADLICEKAKAGGRNDESGPKGPQRDLL